MDIFENGLVYCKLVRTTAKINLADLPVSQEGADTNYPYVYSLNHYRLYLSY